MFSRTHTYLVYPYLDLRQTESQGVNRNNLSQKGRKTHTNKKKPLSQTESGKVVLPETPSLLCSADGYSFKIRKQK